MLIYFGTILAKNRNWASEWRFLQVQKFVSKTAHFTKTKKDFYSNFFLNIFDKKIIA